MKFRSRSLFHKDKANDNEPMKKRVIILVGVLSFALFGIAFAPASVIEGRVNARLGDMGSLKVEGGTIWSGRGVFYWGTPRSRQSPDPQIALPLQWSFAPSTILQLRLGADIRATGDALSGTARVAANGRNVKISNADLKTSMDVVARLFRQLAFTRPSGEVHARTNGESLIVAFAAPLNAQGKLGVAVRDLKLRNITGQVFGTYEGNVAFEGARINYAIDNAKGMLVLGGSGNVDLAARQFQFAGSASTDRFAPVWLPQALQAVGKLGSDGKVAIDYKTNW
jgi:hypothetical protein